MWRICHECTTQSRPYLVTPLFDALVSIAKSYMVTGGGARFLDGPLRTVNFFVVLRNHLERPQLMSLQPATDASSRNENEATPSLRGAGR